MNHAVQRRPRADSDQFLRRPTVLRSGVAPLLPRIASVTGDSDHFGCQKASTNRFTSPSCCFKCCTAASNRPPAPQAGSYMVSWR